MNMVNEQDKYKVMYIYSVVMILFGLFISPFNEIIEGIIKIVSSPALLITDYFKLGGIGAAFVNSGILMVVSVFIGQISKTKVNGPFIAAIFTLGGFSLFGKNIYNAISIVLGTYLYSVIKKDDFSKHIVSALFATSLGPIVSQINFGMNLSPLMGFILGNLGGIIIGLMVPPLASSFVKFHQGFNMYNIGFTAGIVGMVFMSAFRSIGYNHESVSIVFEETNIFVLVFLILYFISMISFGVISSKNSLKEYKDLLNYRIKGAIDFVDLKGFSIVLLNMGVLGILTTLIVLICNAPINGPVIGGIFTVVGFGAFGQHPKNIIPVMMGVIIGYLLIGKPLDTTGSMLTVLFSPTLAPIVGHYGYIPGFLAGILHMSLAANTGYLHGWMNLYNNGFTGGFVAAILVPLFNAYMKDKA